LLTAEKKETIDLALELAQMRLRRHKYEAGSRHQLEADSGIPRIEVIYQFVLFTSGPLCIFRVVHPDDLPKAEKSASSRRFQTKRPFNRRNL
jgi:hypothetical protein